MLRLKFREAATAEVMALVERADAATLDAWEERILFADTVDDVLW